MVYINNGAVVQKRSPWRIGIIVDFFMALMHLLSVFWRTLFDPVAVDQVRSGRNNRRDGNGRGGGGGGRGGGGPRSRIVGMDTLNKADHTARCGGGG